MSKQCKQSTEQSNHRLCRTLCSCYARDIVWHDIFQSPNGGCVLRAPSENINCIDIYVVCARRVSDAQASLHAAAQRHERNGDCDFHVQDWDVIEMYLTTLRDVAQQSRATFGTLRVRGECGKYLMLQCGGRLCRLTSAWCSCVRAFRKRRSDASVKCFSLHWVFRFSP